MDIYSKIRTEATQKELVWVGRITGAIIVVLAILWIPIIKETNNSEQIFVYINSF